MEIRELIARLGKEHTVILSTHILSEVSAVCDKVLIISKGKLVANDNIDHLVNKYNEKQQLTLVVKGNASNTDKVIQQIQVIEERKILE